MTSGIGGDHTTALLAAIVESSHDAILSKDLGGVITSWNAGAERIFGYPQTQAIGRSILMLVPEDRRDEEAGILEQIGKGARVQQFETIRLHISGRPIHVSLTVSPVRGDDGRIIGASTIARDISERKRAEETQRILLREVNHRSKNLLAVVDSIVRQTARNALPADFIERVSRRIQALSANQDLLIKSDWQSVDLLSLVKSQMALHGDMDSSRLQFEGPAYHLTPTAAQALGLALHELSMNALKHGALSTPHGSVEISWQVRDEGREPNFRLTWTERGGPPVSAPSHVGFGSTILDRITALSLRGQATMTYAPGGLVWDIVAPASTILGDH